MFFNWGMVPRAVEVIKTKIPMSPEKIRFNAAMKINIEMHNLLQFILDMNLENVFESFITIIDAKEAVIIAVKINTAML